MNRALTNVCLVLACGVICAGIWVFGDYYDVIFGKSTRSSLRVVENDTTARMESRAVWGLLFGGCLGLVVVVWGVWRRRKGMPEEESDDEL